MALIEETPAITQNEICSKIDMSRATVQRCIKVLVERGKITRVGGKRYGHWEIKQ